MRTLPRCLAACALLLPLAACPGGSTREYRLASIDGDPLPAPITLAGPITPGLEVVGGTLELQQDGTAAETWTLRCRPEVSCTESEQVWMREGTHATELADVDVRIDDAHFLTTSVTATRDRIVLRTRERRGTRAAEFTYLR